MAVRWGLGKTCLEKMGRGRNTFASISLLAEGVSVAFEVLSALSEVLTLGLQS